MAEKLAGTNHLRFFRDIRRSDLKAFKPTAQQGLPLAQYSSGRHARSRLADWVPARSESASPAMIGDPLASFPQAASGLTALYLELSAM